LLDSKTQLPASSTPSASGGGVPDPGFNQSLPYGSQAKPNGGTGNSAALGAPDTRLATSKERPTSLLFMAAGLLATVLLMHVLWVKSEVDRVALDPLPARAREEPRLP